MSEIVKNGQKGFKIGSAKLSDNYFYGREDEILELLKSFREGRHTALKEERRHGKTVLVEKAMEHFSDEGFCMKVDLRSTVSFAVLRRDLIDKFLHEAVKEYGKIAEGLAFTFSGIKSLFNGGKVDIEGFGLKGSFTNFEENIVKGKEIEAFLDAFKIIDILSTIKKKKAIIFIDEVQDLVSLAGEDYPSLAKKFKATIEGLENTTIIIAGSEPSIVRELITEMSTNFLMHFYIMEMRGIEPLAFKIHLKEACAQNSINIDGEVSTLCSTLSGGVASTLTHFGAEILRRGSGQSSLESIKRHDIFEIANEYINSYITDYKRKVAVLKSIPSGDFILTSIINKTYYTWGEAEHDAHDEAVDALCDELIIREDAFGVLQIVDPLLLIYYNNPNKTRRTRLLKEQGKGIEEISLKTFLIKELTSQ